jgi:hypothetical protein
MTFYFCVTRALNIEASVKYDFNFSDMVKYGLVSVVIW